MKPTQKLHDLGQSLWLDNITRDLLDKGTLRRYISEFAITGLTSNPPIFDHAIQNASPYDAAIRTKNGEGTYGEALFPAPALRDPTRPAEPCPADAQCPRSPHHRSSPSARRTVVLAGPNSVARALATSSRDFAAIFASCSKR